MGQGKGARARSKEKRLKVKKARKEKMQTQYQTWAAAGQNKKTKRNLRGKKGVVKSTRHAISYCGNLGCKKCHPEFSNPDQAKKGTALYRHWAV